MQHGVALVVAQRGLGGARGSRRARIAETLAAVLGAQPAVPIARDIPAQTGVDGVLGRVAQRFARIAAALLFAFRVGVVGAGRQGLAQREARVQLDAACDGLIHVDGLAERIDVGPVAEADAAGTVGRRTVAAIDEARARRDLVLEGIVEHGAAGRPAGQVVEVGADFRRRARFRLQVRAADEGNRALAAETVDAWRQLFHARRLVALADATLDGPARCRVPHGIRAGAGLAAEDAVIVIAGAEGQREMLQHLPFVFHEQGFLREFECLWRHAIRHFRFPPLRADGRHVFAQRHDQFGVEHLAFHFQRARAAGHGARRARRNRAAQGFRLVHHVAAVERAKAEAARVRQGPLVALVFLFWPVAALHGLGAELAARIVVGLAARVGVEDDGVVAVWREGQARAKVFNVRTHGVGAHVRRGSRTVRAVVADVGRIAALLAAAQGQAQQVGGDGAAQVEAAAFHVAESGFFLQGVVGRDGAHPLLAHLARDDVDHAAHGVRAVQGRHGAADDFDALDGGQRRHEARLRAAEAVRRDVAGRVLAPSVDQHQGVVAGHAADADVHAARLVARRAHVDAFHAFQRLRQVAEALLRQFLARQHRDRRGRLLDILLEAGRGHDHFRHAGRRARLGVSRQAGQGGHGQGQGGGTRQARAAGAVGHANSWRVD